MAYSPEIDSYLKVIRFPTFKGQAPQKDSFQSPGYETRPEQPLVEYPDYCNNRRIKAKLKGLPPAIHRQQALSAA